jgi:hypothetical protein
VPRWLRVLVPVVAITLVLPVTVVVLATLGAVDQVAHVRRRAAAI